MYKQLSDFTLEHVQFYSVVLSSFQKYVFQLSNFFGLIFHWLFLLYLTKTFIAYYIVEMGLMPELRAAVEEMDWI